MLLNPDPSAGISEKPLIPFPVSGMPGSQPLVAPLLVLLSMEVLLPQGLAAWGAGAWLRWGPCPLLLAALTWPQCLALAEGPPHPQAAKPNAG